jgi:hypothetical protein
MRKNLTMDKNKRLLDAVEYLIKQKQAKSYAEISRMLGKSTAYFSDLKNEKFDTTRQFIEDFIREFPSISKEWILLGTGNMLNSNINQHNISGRNVAGSDISGDVFSGNKIVNQNGKILEKKDNRMNDFKSIVQNAINLFKNELEAFHKIQEQKDLYIQNVVEKSYLRNCKNTENISKLIEQQDKIITTNSKMCEAIIELLKK